MKFKGIAALLLLGLALSSVLVVGVAEAKQGVCLKCQNLFGLMWCEASSYGYQECHVIGGRCVGVGECTVELTVAR